MNPDEEKPTEQDFVLDNIVVANDEAKARVAKIQGFTVMLKRCNECLFDKDRLVDAPTAGKILKEAVAAGTYFSCHKFSMRDNDSEEPGPYTPTQVCCRAFYDTAGHVSQQIRMAERLGIVTFVDMDGKIQT